MPISKDYIKARDKIKSAKKRTLDREQIGFYTGYVTALRDWGIINDVQIKKLDQLIRKGEY